MRSFLAALLPLSLALLACNGGKGGDTGPTGAGDDTGDGDDTADDEQALPENAADAVQTYAEIAQASYTDSLVAAQALDTAIDTFVAAPSAAGLEAARDAWLASREPYLQTEVYRFYDGPIDNPTDGPEGLINAWPLDEGYIDYVTGLSTAGIINDTSITIDADTLVAANEAGGEKNIATGYHAIEFLLWGQDESDAGPGDRPWQDYLTGDLATADNGDRRALYLGVVSDLLVTHLEWLAASWDLADGTSYGSGFAGDDAAASMERILTGMIVLSGFETGGERLQAALDSGDQEDEHSCFSDNTHRDMVGDVVGVQNVWRGSYTRTDGSVVSGVGVRDVVEAADPDLASRLDEQIDTSVALAEALQPPFDNEIAPGNTEGNARVQALVDSLRAQEDLLFEVFTLFGMTVEIPE